MVGAFLVFVVARRRVRVRFVRFGFDSHRGWRLCCHCWRETSRLLRRYGLYVRPTPSLRPRPTRQRDGSRARPGTGTGPWYGTTRNPRSRGSRSDSGPGWYSTGTNAAPRNERSGAGSLRRYSTVLGSRSGPVERRPRPTVRVGRRVVRRKYGRRDRPAPGTAGPRPAPGRGAYRICIQGSVRFISSEQCFEEEQRPYSDLCRIYVTCGPSTPRGAQHKHTRLCL